MDRGETLFARTMFVVILVFKMLIPPMYSLERLEGYCKFRLRKNPTAYSPRWFLAELYRYYQKNEEAKREYLELRKLGYMTDKDRLRFGQVLFRLQDFQGVTEVMAPVIDKSPRDKNTNWYLGISYLKQNELEKAVMYLERAINAGIRRYEDYGNLGYCYDRLGEFDKATEAYSAALALRPDSREVRRNMALVYLKTAQPSVPGNLEAAERAVQKALDVDPGNAEALTLLEKLDQLKKQSSDGAYPN